MPRDQIKGEVITATEAFKRIGLELPVPGGELSQPLVEWTGYPAPFACGVTEKAKLHEGTPYENEQTYRRCQFICGGPVLYTWPCVAKSYANGELFYLRSKLVVAIDNVPGYSMPILRAGITD